MILATIDPKAGTHFTGKIFVTQHACDRAVEYFGIDRKSAPMHVMDLLRKAALIDPCIIGENSAEPTRLYAYKGYALVVSLNEDTVVTIYPRNHATQEIRDNVGKALKRILAAAQRHEARELRRLAIERAELDVRTAELNLRLLRTNLTSIKRKINEELSHTASETIRINAEMNEVRREKSTVAAGVCAFV